MTRFRELSEGGQIVGVKVYRTSALREKKTSLPSLMNVVLTGAMMAGGARMANISRPVNLDLESQKHTFQVDPEEIGLDSYRRHTNERLNIRVPQLVSAVGARNVTRYERANSMTPEQAAKLQLFESLKPLSASVFFNGGLNKKRTLLGLMLTSFLLASCGGSAPVVAVETATAATQGAETAVATGTATATEAPQVIEFTKDTVKTSESMALWQNVPASLTPTGDGVLVKMETRAYLSDGALGVLSPLTDGKTMDTSDKYAFGLTTFNNVPLPGMQPDIYYGFTLFHQKDNGPIETGMLQVIGHPDETKWEYQVVHMTERGATREKVLTAAPYTLVRRIMEDYETYSLKYASGKEVPLSLVTASEAEPTSPPTAIPNDAVAAVFNSIPDGGQMVVFRTNGAKEMPARPAGEFVRPGMFFDFAANEWAYPNPEKPDKPFHYKNVEGLVQGWFWDAGGGALMDEPGLPSFMTINILCEEGQQCPMVRHIPNTATPNKDLTFSKLLATVLYDERFKEIYAQRQALDPNAPSFSEDLNAGKIKVSFVTINGDKYVYKIKEGGSAINIYVAKDVPNSDVEWSFEKAKFGGDDEGNYNVVVASPKPIESLSNDDFRDLIFFPALRIFVTENVSQRSVPNSNSGTLLALTTQGDHPHFVITP